jgi:hypothetical protein
MPFYPILKAPGAKGWTTLCNFPPNNWETTSCRDRIVNVTWFSSEGWRTKNLGVLKPNAVRTVKADEIADVIPENALALLSLTAEALPESCEYMPELDSLRTNMPAWRASLGLSTEFSQTSYQGELDPFPPQGSLLTFGPFLQYGSDVENYLILLNLENSRTYRHADLEVYNANGATFLKSFQIRNIESNIIPLNGLGFQPGDLPMFICRNMSGIPLYFSRTVDGIYLSLEHTHPPASFVVLGKRSEAQKILKKYWFAKAAHHVY